jgi:hypothetical protein
MREVFKEGKMVSVIIWLMGAAGIFLWNYYKVPYIGIRFTEKVVGFPISGAWLCVALAIYCLIRFFVRKKQDKIAAQG